MRQVCELKKLAGGRYLVSLDDGSSFPLYGKELDEYQIREEEELSDSDYDKIMAEVLPKRAKLCVMHLLEKMDKTEHQLRQKLAALFYPEDILEEAISYVKKYHYVDDVRYAASYMEYRRENKSVRQMEQELFQKGISKAVFLEALEQIDAPDEEKQIRIWLQKKQYQPENCDRKETNRIYNFLLRKGYSPSSIQRVMRLQDWYE